MIFSAIITKIGRVNAKTWSHPAWSRKSSIFLQATQHYIECLSLKYFATSFGPATFFQAVVNASLNKFFFTFLRSIKVDPCLPHPPGTGKIIPLLNEQKTDWSMGDRFTIIKFLSSWMVAKIFLLTLKAGKWKCLYSSAWGRDKAACRAISTEITCGCFH